jgi:aspartokinase/homoserine dehydrogenase 1
LSVVTRKCQCRFITQASEHSICIGILNSDADISSTINKAFEVEILQNKIKPCIVEKPVHHSISWRKYENHQGLSGRMFSTGKTM